jgi:hypothetical protein
MSSVFQNIDPRTPSLPFGVGGGHTHWVERGWGEDVRHCSVLYICKYFVVCMLYQLTVATLLHYQIRNFVSEISDLVHQMFKNLLHR